MTEVGDLVAWLERPPTKLVAVVDPEAVPALRGALAERFGGSLFLTTSLPYLLELGNPSASKGTGLQFVAERIGLDAASVVSFGDGENDVELIEWAGYGVAVEGGHPRLLELADWVCPARRRRGRRHGDRRVPGRRRLHGVIDLKSARTEPDAWRAALDRKGAADAFDRLLAADERWRSLVPRVDELRGATKLKGKPTPEQLEELQRVKEELKAAEEQLAAAEAERDAALGEVPNPPHPSAPDGLTEDDSVELRRVGEPPVLEQAREHTEIGRFEMERAARLSGSRFGYIVGDSALVAMALYRFALDHLARHGFTPVIPPVLVREEAMVGTGFFPTEKSNIYELEADALYLTGTSEVSLAGFHMGEILEARDLPLRYTGFSTCFRREAGAAGKDTRGMFRVHQFNKVEMFVFTRPDESWDEHDRMLALEEELCRRSSCRTGSSTSPPATSAHPRPRSTTSRRGSRSRSATAR